MRRFSFCLFILMLTVSGNLFAQRSITKDQTADKELIKLFDAYGLEWLQLDPLGATDLGFNFYNDLLPADFTDSYQDKQKAFCKKYLAGLLKIPRDRLNENDKLSYDIFKYNQQMAIESFNYKDNRMPFNQFGGVPLDMGRLGSGTVIQPFKTVKDYRDWISRATAFSAWADSAIVYFRKGIKEGIVLPKALVVKMLPQLQSFITADPTKSIFYGPVNNFPKDFNDSVKTELTTAYVRLIKEQLVPSYQKLHDFLESEYLPHARASSGMGALPNGKEWYNYKLRSITTTNVSAAQLYTTGLAEVNRIRKQVEKIKEEVGFKGDIKAFFEYVRTDPKFFPYKSPDEVLNAYRAIQKEIEPKLSTIFLNKPKTTFEIRQTEGFRAASSAAEYYAGLADGSRPGIFYVPIVDVSKQTIAVKSLFAHETIPGHHYQIMLQIENGNLPGFRRYGGFVAYSEGWGLYSEDLGNEMGLYNDSYQKVAYLRYQLHRAIRLVVDPGLHARGWTREQAIDYMLNNEPVSREEAVSEIERYMAQPAQAVAYKVGELKILELRKRYQKQLGSAFSLAAFHNELLKDGAMPLDVLQQKMDRWASTKGK